MREVGDDVVVGMVDGFESMGIRFRFYLFVLLVGGVGSCGQVACAFHGCE